LTPKQERRLNVAAGKRPTCCFDRSAFYSTSLSAPKAAESKIDRDIANNPQGGHAKAQTRLVCP